MVVNTERLTASLLPVDTGTGSISKEVVRDSGVTDDDCTETEVLENGGNKIFLRVEFAGEAVGLDGVLFGGGGDLTTVAEEED